MINKRIVLYYATWCGHCNDFKPIWFELEKLIKAHKDDLSKKYNVAITTETFEESENPDVMEQNNIEGFPTIKIYEDSNDKKGVEYENRRTMHAIMKEVVPNITTEDLDTWFPEKQTDDAEENKPTTINDSALAFLKELPLLDQNGGTRSRKSAYSYYNKYMTYKNKYLKMKSQ